MTASVRVNQLGVRFGRREAVRGVTLHRDGGLTALVGRNGSGKTTLLRCLATVLHADAGTVRVDTLDPRQPHEQTRIRERLGYVPQDPRPPLRMTAFEFVDYVAVLKGFHEEHARHREVARVLELVDLTGRADARIRELSGGMRRRAAVAQALLGRPSLVVLDEPATGLDPEQRAQLRGVLRAATDHATVVLATHLGNDLASWCDSVVVMDDGRSLFDGTPGQLRAIADSPDASLEDGYLALLARRHAA